MPPAIVEQAGHDAVRERHDVFRARRLVDFESRQRIAGVAIDLVQALRSRHRDMAGLAAPALGKQRLILHQLRRQALHAHAFRQRAQDGHGLLDTLGRCLRRGKRRRHSRRHRGHARLFLRAACLTCRQGLRHRRYGRPGQRHGPICIAVGQAPDRAPSHRLPPGDNAARQVPRTLRAPVEDGRASRGCRLAAAHPSVCGHSITGGQRQPSRQHADRRPGKWRHPSLPVGSGEDRYALVAWRRRRRGSKLRVAPAPSTLQQRR